MATFCKNTPCKFISSLLVKEILETQQTTSKNTKIPPNNLPEHRQSWYLQNKQKCKLPNYKVYILIILYMFQAIIDDVLNFSIKRLQILIKKALCPAELEPAAIECRSNALPNEIQKQIDSNVRQRDINHFAFIGMCTCLQ